MHIHTLQETKFLILSESPVVFIKGTHKFSQKIVVLVHNFQQSEHEIIKCFNQNSSKPVFNLKHKN